MGMGDAKKLALATALLGLLFSPRPLEADASFAKRAVERMMSHDSFGAEGARTKMRMVIRTKSGATRRRSLDWISRKDGNLVKSVVRFRSPADVAGAAFLLIQRHGRADEQYVYLPALKRVRRILGRERRGSFMGSDLSYADLERRDLDAAVYRQRSDEEVGGHPCYVIESRPKAGREDDHPYGKIVLWIRKSDYVALRIQFFDDAGRLQKTLFSRRVRVIDGRPVTVEARMENHETGGRTELFIDHVEFTNDVPEDEFTQRALESR